MTDHPNHNHFDYFSIQAEWGVTKHFGGQRATDRLAAMTQISAGQRLLEIGCGTGLGSSYLAQAYNCRVTGVDLSPRMAAWAKASAQRKGVSGSTGFLAADAQALPFPEAVFDVALCESVTAFVPDKVAALREYGRVVRPGGYVALNEGVWLSEPPAALRDFVTRSMNGVQFQTDAGWRALIEAAGLEAVQAQVERISVLRQRLDEVSGLDWQDWMARFKAIGVLSKMLFTDPDFRRYARTLTPSRRMLREMFEYMGYGLYAGRRPA